jgi:hypothetical protein
MVVLELLQLLLEALSLLVAVEAAVLFLPLAMELVAVETEASMEALLQLLELSTLVAVVAVAVAQLKSVELVVLVLSS